jgi:hypothetical protein
MSDLANFMAGIRRVETGDLKGDYLHSNPPEGGLRAVGAYGFTDWRRQAAAAGFPDANMSDFRAQDAVAGTLFRNLYEKYQTWDLVALAWYTNERTADSVKESGYRDLDQIKHPRVKEYIQSVVNATAEAEASPTQFKAPIIDSAPPSGPMEPGPVPRTFRASELMAQFVDDLSNQIAGGQRTPIDELAPKVITDVSQAPGVVPPSDAGPINAEPAGMPVEEEVTV